eukprot:1348470-Pyramimonas_sp.AAC.1
MACCSRHAPPTNAWTPCSRRPPRGSPPQSSRWAVLSCRRRETSSVLPGAPRRHADEQTSRAVRMRPSQS